MSPREALDEPGARLHVVLVSALVCAVIGLQAFQGTSPYKRIRALPLDPATKAAFVARVKPPAWYPFLDYPMYSVPHYPGDAVDRYAVYGVLADGSEVAIRPEDVSASWFAFREHMVDTLRNGQMDRVLPLVELYQRTHGVELEALRLENRPVVIERDGVRFAGPETVAVRPLRGAGPRPS